MDAFAEHLVGLGQCRERKLALGELGLHPRYTPAYMRPGLSTPAGSKARLRRSVSRREARRLGLEHRPRRPCRRIGADQSRVSACSGCSCTHRGFTRVLRPVDREPDKSASPVEESTHFCRVRDARGCVRARCRRYGEAPERPAVLGERTDVPNLAPERRRVPRVKLFDRAEAAEQLAQRLAARLHRGGKPLDPDRRDRRTCVCDVRDSRARSPPPPAYGQRPRPRGRSRAPSPWRPRPRPARVQKPGPCACAPARAGL